jgi:hypothetical protein
MHRASHQQPLCFMSALPNLPAGTGISRFADSSILSAARFRSATRTCFRAIAEFSCAQSPCRYSVTTNGDVAHLRQSNDGKRWRKVFILSDDHYRSLAEVFHLQGTDIEVYDRFMHLVEVLQCAWTLDGFNSMPLSDDLAANWARAQRFAAQPPRYRSPRDDASDDIHVAQDHD